MKIAMSNNSRLQLFFFILIALTISVAAADEAASLFNRAEGFFNDGLYISAAEKYQTYVDLKRSSLKQNPENCPSAYYKIAWCYFRTSNFSRAAAAFEEFVRLFPQDHNVLEALFQAGNAYTSLADYKNASDSYYRVWGRGQGKPLAQKALIESAVCAEKDNDNERAAVLYDQYINKFRGKEKSSEASLSLVKVLILQKDFAGASTVLAKTEKQWNTDGGFFVRALYYKAKLAHVLQKDENAQRFYSALMNQDVDFPEKEQALIDYGVLLKELKEYKTALTVYKKLSDFWHKRGTGDSRDFISSWAECAVSAGYFEGAEKLYRRVLATFPDNARTDSVTMKIALCQLGMKDYSGAIETLQDLARGDNGREFRAAATLALGDVYYDQGLYPNALSAYTVYCGLPDAFDCDRVLFKIAKTYQDQGRFPDAGQEFELLLQRYPQSVYSSPASYSLAQCSEALGDFQTAIRYYDYCVQSSGPADIIEQAKKRRDYLKKYRGNNLALAVEAVAGLVQKASDSLSAYERIFSIADIFENMLDNFGKAGDLYEQVLRCIPSPPDSILTRAVFCRARVFEKIHQKALMENDSLGAAQAKARAVALYQEVARKPRYAVMADDAAFRILMLGHPSISDYERYAAKYPGSRHLIEALYLTGAYYEKKAVEANAEMNDKALARNAYARIVHAPVSGHSAEVAEAYLGLVRTYLSDEKLDSARSFADEFLRYNADSTCAAEGEYLSGIIERKQGNYPAAIEVFKKIFSRYPFSRFAQRSRCEMASAQLAFGKPQEALRNFRLYMQNYPGGEYYNEARLGVAQCTQRSGKNDEACQMLSELLKEKCGSALTGSVYAELANCAKNKGDVHGALEHLAKALSLDSFPDKGPVCASMGTIYFENGMYPDAARAFERALQYARGKADSTAALTGGMVALVMDGQERKAEKAINFFKAMFGERHPALAEVVYHKGLRFLVEKDYDKALNSFKYLGEKFTASSRCDDAAYQTGVCYYYQGKQEKALDVFNDFIARYPESEFVPMAYFKIGMTHHDRGDFTQAAQLFEKVVPFTRTDEKTRFRAAYNAAIDYQKTGSWLDAARLYQTIVDSFPQEVSHSSTYLKIGFCCIQGARMEDALKKLQKAGASNPAAQEKPEIVYWTATCYAKLGDLQKAVSEYLKVPAQFENAGQWPVTSEYEAARIYERLGDVKKAYNLYKKIVLTDGENGEIGKEALEQISRLNIQAKEN
jgi:tetratricopeptide (TPR) repeat protein